MKLVLAILLFFSITGFSQNINGYPRNSSDTLPMNFKLDATKLRNHIYGGIPSTIKQGEYPRRVLHFAQENAYSISELISSGKVYSDNMPLENYLNDILRKVIPNELKDDSVIHAYVMRDGSFNAFMTPTGHTYIHSFILAYWGMYQMNP